MHKTKLSYQPETLPEQPYIRSLRGPCQKNLKVCGQFSGVMQYRNIMIEQKVFVIHDYHKALIGLPEIQALELVDNIALEIPKKIS